MTLLRESGYCSYCFSANRERQVAYLINKVFALASPMTFSDGATILNAESQGAFHSALSKNKGYIATEYFSGKYAPGEIVHGIRNEDFQCLTFDDNTFDLVVTRDVFEHIPDPYKVSF